MRYTAPGFLLVALVTLLAVILSIALALNVARKRVRYGVQAPTMSGHPEFERAFRIHANTVEYLAPFLAALWLCAIYLQPLVAGIVGFVWIVGRIVYAFGYSAAAAKRRLGFGISMIALILLILGALIGVVSAYLGQPWR
ncbi:MAG TPA: MAPEG family protein [Alphaproteobacteria bacterium]|nr:MAPEG family protein [Alphaproteobacteria bacterium]